MLSVLVGLDAPIVLAESAVPNEPKDNGDSDFIINAGITDAWFSPATAGQGFSITVFSELGQVFLAWFTFDAERPAEDHVAVLGEPGHRWLTAQGAFVGNTAELTLFNSIGGVFDAAEPIPETDQAGVGSLTLEFDSCTSGMATYNMPELGLSGEFPIQRIVEDNVAVCEALWSEQLPDCSRSEPDLSHGPDDPTVVNDAIVRPSDLLDGGPGPDGIPALDSPNFVENPGIDSTDRTGLVAGVKIGSV